MYTIDTQSVPALGKYLLYSLFQLEDCLAERTNSSCVLDGSSINDIPAVYTINGLLHHELPVKGTFVHPWIVPGFSYIVRPVDSYKQLFGGKAVCLQKIGMGYGKRLTFGGQMHDNDNYFWSDSNPEGYGFSLELVHTGDKFTVLDIANQPVASLQVTYIMAPQNESDESSKSAANRLEKQSFVTLQCTISYYEDMGSFRNTVIVSGIAISVKKRKSNSPAEVIRVSDCFINGSLCTLVPSKTQVIQRSKSVFGEHVNDIPTTYFIAGLLPNELPVIGTFVDARITPGFKYKVRLLDSGKQLFEGQARTLKSVGRGYGKRITFSAESGKQNNNYFWSDTNPEGYGLTLEAVHEEDCFSIEDSCKKVIGKAKVYKMCGPQIELASFCAEETRIFTKHVKVSMACHLLLFENSQEITTRVQGIAVLKREKCDSSVKIIQHLEFPHVFHCKNLLENLTFVNT